jgi:hypothetical protein
MGKLLAPATATLAEIERQFVLENGAREAAHMKANLAERPEMGCALSLEQEIRLRSSALGFPIKMQIGTGSSHACRT